jgi:AcrR family transcriptional regulator
MLAAMAETMTEKGFAGTTVAEIIRRAGVSRETFYQQFDSRQDCFIQALDAGVEILAGLLDSTGSGTGAGTGTVAGETETRNPLVRFRELLRVYLHTLAESPAMARVFMVEVYAAGPEAMQRLTDQQRRFADAISRIFGATSTEQRFACEALVAATAQLVTFRLVADDLDGLRGLEDPLVALAARLLG